MENKIVQNDVQITASERFQRKVLNEFGGSVGEIQITTAQKLLVQGYFIVIDRMLKTGENDRLTKNAKATDPKYVNDLPYNWKNVNLTDLAIDLVHYARMGLDMLQPNMLFPIAYKNNKTQKYDVTLMKGYNGVRYIAEKYAMEPPKSVAAEVVYSTDKFRPIKKNASSEIENYEFEITSPFDRGEIIGGFAYLEFSDPAKNKLIIMSMKDVEKRKPQYASPNFWGGKTTVWENGTRVEKEVEGWRDEMVKKTVLREAYSPKHIPLDPTKVDEAYHAAKLREVRYAELEAEAEIEENANKIVIDANFSDASDEPEKLLTLDTATGEVSETEALPEF